MDTAVYAFYATFSFIMSLIFVLALGAGLYSFYLTRKNQDVEEEEGREKGRYAFLYKRKNGIWLIIIAIIFGIVGYRTQPSKFSHEIAEEGPHAVHKQKVQEVRKQPVKKAHEEIAEKVHKKEAVAPVVKAGEKVQKAAPEERAKIIEKIIKPSTAEIEQLKKQVADLEQKGAVKEQKIKLLEQELAKTKDKLAKTTKQAMKSSDKVLKQELAKMKYLLAQKTEQDLKSRQALFNLTKKLKAANKKLHFSNMRLEKVDLLESQLKHADTELNRARAAIASLEKQLHNTQKQRDAAEGELAKASVTINDLKKQNQLLQQKLLQKVETSEAFQSAKSELSQKFEVQNRQLKDALQKAKAELAQAAATINNLKKQNQLLQQKLEKSAQAAQSNQAAETAKSELNQKFELQNKQLEDAMQKAKAELAQAAITINNLKKQNQLLEQKLEKGAQAVKSNQAAEIEKLKNDLRAMKNTVDMKLIELTELNSKYQLLQDLTKMKDEKVQRLMDTNKAMQKRISILQTRIGTLESELKTKDLLLHQIQKTLAGEEKGSSK